jgi:hypothetical protein
MSDRTYTCTTAGCPRQQQPTGARWCVACSKPTQSEPAAPWEPAPAGDPDGPARPAAGVGLRPGVPAPGRPLLSAEWRQSAVTAAVAVGAMLAFSLLLVALLASSQGASDNVGSLIRLALTLVPLSMRGALVVGGSAPSTGADQGQLSLVLPPLLGAVVGLTALAVATSRRVREAPPPTPGPLALEALRTGAAFAALMGLVTLLTHGTVQDAATGKLSWHVAPIGVACWSLLLGTLAAGLGGVAGVVRTGHSRELLAAASPAQRGWLRALGGGAVAAGTALVLGAVAVAVLVGMGMSRYAATQVSSLLQISPGPVVGLAALFLPGAAIQALGLGLGATVVAGSPDDTTRAGHLAGSGLPGWAHLLLLVPALAVVAGGLWTAAREQAEPEPQPGGWLRYAAATTALFGLLLVLARIKVEGSTVGGVSSALPLLQSSGQDHVSAVVGFRLFDGLLLAFGWAALGGVVAERLFPVLLLRYGRRVAQVRVGPLGLLPASPATAQQPPAPKRRTRTVGMLAATMAVVGVAVWLGAGHRPAGTPDGSVAAEAATPTTTVAVTEPTLGVPPETIATPSSSPEVAGSSVSELAADATATASATTPDSVDAAGSPISYSAGNITDGDAQTAWRAEGDGRGVTLTLTLPSPVHLTRVGLIPGYAKVDPSNGVDRFPENRRVREGPLALPRRDHRRPAVRRQPDHAGHRRRHDHQLGDHRDPQHPAGYPRPRLRAHLGGVARRHHPVRLTPLHASLVSPQTSSPASLHRFGSGPRYRCWTVSWILPVTVTCTGLGCPTLTIAVKSRSSSVLTRTSTRAAALDWLVRPTTASNDLKRAPRS